MKKIGAVVCCRSIRTMLGPYIYPKKEALGLDGLLFPWEKMIAQRD
jgi:hypothetical protein